jgi:hypothetical protein
VTTDNGQNGQASPWGLLKGLLVLGLIVWGGWAWWQLRAARQAGQTLRESVARQWPEDGPPQPGTRQRLLLSAGRLSEGDFRAVVMLLKPVYAPTTEQQEAARRFLAEHAELSGWLVAVAADAEAFEVSDGDAGPARDELARALLAAARDDAEGVAAHLDVAEEVLAEAAFGGRAAARGDPSALLAAQLRAIEPGVVLGRELMLEGHAAVERLLRLAATHARDEDHREAGYLVRLAAGLSAVDIAGAEAAGDELPPWFRNLPPPEIEDATENEAKHRVELCQAAAASLEASEPIGKLIERARRELAAGRPAEAAWFAGVALAALGIEQGPTIQDDESMTGKCYDRNMQDENVKGGLSSANQMAGKPAR